MISHCKLFWKSWPLCLLLCCLGVCPSAHAASATDTTITQGLFHGRIEFLQSPAIALRVEGIKPSAGMKTFYLDPATIYTIKKKSATLADFPPGTEVAVRYFAVGRLHVAKQVYLVEGEFHARDFQPKVAKRKAKKE